MNDTQHITQAHLRINPFGNFNTQKMLSQFIYEAPEEEEESSADERENVELDNYRDNLFSELRSKLENMDGQTKQETMQILTQISQNPELISQAPNEDIKELNDTANRFAESFDDDNFVTPLPKQRTVANQEEEKVKLEAPEKPTITRSTKRMAQRSAEAPNKSTVVRSSHRMTLRSARRLKEEKKAVQSLVVSKGNNVIYDQYSSKIKSSKVKYPLAIAKQDVTLPKSEPYRLIEVEMIDKKHQKFTLFLKGGAEYSCTHSKNASGVVLVGQNQAIEIETENQIIRISSQDNFNLPRGKPFVIRNRKERTAKLTISLV